MLQPRFAAYPTAALAAAATASLQEADGTTPLHIAAINGDAAAIATLLEGGAKVSKKLPNGLTALHLAGQDNRVTAVKALLAGGWAVEESDV